MTDQLTLDELKRSRIRAAAALVATAGAYITNPPPRARDQYASSGVPNSSGKANPAKKAERKRQRKARRKSR